MSFDLKNFLKSYKTNESTISMILGALVVVIVAVLLVNYFKDRGGNTLTGANTEGEMQTNVHVVTKGESLWSISEDYYGSGYNWTDVAKANGLKTYTLEVGQKLTLPDVAAKQPTSTKLTASTQEQSQGTISGDSYTVVHGDNLWDIAVRAYGDGYKWVDIAKANNLKNPNVIHAGNVFTLPR